MSRSEALRLETCVLDIRKQQHLLQILIQRISTAVDAGYKCE